MVLVSLCSAENNEHNLSQEFLKRGEIGKCLESPLIEILAAMYQRPAALISVCSTIFHVV